MARGYQFIDQKTREAVLLNTVDRLMCEHTGQAESDTQYCELYQYVLHYGFAYLMRTHEGHIRPWADLSIVPSWDDLSQDLKDGIMWALTQWEFHAWG